MSVFENTRFSSAAAKSLSPICSGKPTRESTWWMLSATNNRVMSKRDLAVYLRLPSALYVNVKCSFLSTNGFVLLHDDTGFGWASTMSLTRRRLPFSRTYTGPLSMLRSQTEHHRTHAHEASRLNTRNTAKSLRTHVPANKYGR